MTRRFQRPPSPMCECRHTVWIHRVKGYAPGCALCPCAVFRQVQAPTPPAPDVTRNRHKGNANSEAANELVDSEKKRQRGLILAYIESVGMDGATREAISFALKVRYTTVSARVSELLADGELDEAGTRPTTSGAPAGVLRAKEIKNFSLFGQPMKEPSGR